MDEEKKVYIVTSGEYSPYGIDAVFSYESDAEDYADRHNRADRYPEHRVEAFVLNESYPLDRSGKIAFHVGYTLKSEFPLRGNSWYAYGEPDKTELPFADVQNKELSDPFILGGKSHYWETWVWAKDNKDALKIGADKIMPVLAEMQIKGVEPPKPNPLELDTPFLTALGGPPVMGDYTRKVEWGINDGK